MRRAEKAGEWRRREAATEGKENEETAAPFRLPFPFPLSLSLTPSLSIHENSTDGDALQQSISNMRPFKGSGGVLEGNARMESQRG